MSLPKGERSITNATLNLQVAEILIVDDDIRVARGINGETTKVVTPESSQCYFMRAIVVGR
ncbi:MAG: hypothetical protein HOI20_15505 [Gemmatimonadetes bacterium]|nr:hypothetical protein [Gemmatimonadota bacterium]